MEFPVLIFPFFCNHGKTGILQFYGVKECRNKVPYSLPWTTSLLHIHLKKNNMWNWILNAFVERLETVDLWSRYVQYCVCLPLTLCSGKDCIYINVKILNAMSSIKVHHVQKWKTTKKLRKVQPSANSVSLLSYPPLHLSICQPGRL